MKRFILSCGFVLVATSAMAGGIYTNTNTTTVDHGNNTINAWETAWSTNIPGGSISQDNAMRVHVSLYGAGTAGSVRLKLNGQILGIYDVFETGQTLIDLVVTRTTSTQGAIHGIVNFPDIGVFPAYYDDYTIGLAWGSAQTLLVEIKNSVGGGTHFASGGVER